MADKLIYELQDIKEDVQTNLKPENLKKGVTCLGVEGTLDASGGVDISDATAVDTDILKNKIAYGKNGRTIGSFVPPEPIYGIDDVVITTIPGWTCRLGFSRLYEIDDSIIKLNTSYTDSSTASGGKVTLYKLNEEDNTLTQIVETSISGYNTIAILDIIENDIYYAICDSNYIYIKKFNTESSLDTLCFSERKTSSSGFDNSVFFVGKNRMLWGNRGTAYGYMEVDLENNKILRQISNSCVYFLNKHITVNSARDKIFDISSFTEKTFSKQKIRFMNKDDNKIIIDNTLYNVASNFSLGEVIKENVFDNLIITINNGYFSHYDGDYYYLVNNASDNLGYLMKFDEDTNTFTNICELPSLSPSGNYGNQYTFLNDSKQVCMLSSTKNNVLKGYTYEGHTMYFDNNLLNTDNILSGYQAYSKTGDILAGTMLNNGEINITPSTEEQTIPKGYTPGGVVSGDKNLLPENIKAGITIFGVEGTYTGETVE